MSRRFAGPGFWACGLILLLTALASAAQPEPPPAPVIVPKRYVAAPPGPHRYLEYNTGCYPWYGYGLGVPTYNWGYFGAHYRPAPICHQGYYGDFYQWGYRRGY